EGLRRAGRRATGSPRRGTMATAEATSCMRRGRRPRALRVRGARSASGCTAEMAFAPKVSPRSKWEGSVRCDGSRVLFGEYRPPPESAQVDEPEQLTRAGESPELIGPGIFEDNVRAFEEVARRRRDQDFIGAG